jgi:hypothetical protein
VHGNFQEANDSDLGQSGKRGRRQIKKEQNKTKTTLPNNQWNFLHFKCVKKAKETKTLLLCEESKKGKRGEERILANFSWT